MKKEKVIVIIEPKEKGDEDIKEILKKIVEENIRTYLFKDGFKSE